MNKAEGSLWISRIWYPIDAETTEVTADIWEYLLAIPTEPIFIKPSSLSFAHGLVCRALSVYRKATSGSSNTGAFNLIIFPYVKLRYVWHTFCASRFGVAPNGRKTGNVAFVRQLLSMVIYILVQLLIMRGCTSRKFR